MNTVLALDMGASGGRAIVGTYDGNVITLEETHRFENIPVTLDTGLCWDIDALMREIKTGIKKSCDVARIESVGIDTWGVDFGLIGFDGALLENPAHYRNERTDGMLEEAFKLMPSSDIYARTGIQIMQINTLYQLLYLKKQRPELLDKTDKLLFMPDLFAYLLTGVKKAEYTIASTSQMLNPFTRDWDHELLEKFGIPGRILCHVSQSPSACGPVSEDICAELGIEGLNIVSVGSHDTASALLAVPAEEGEYAYLSSGTWSLFGTDIDAPIVNRQSEGVNFTNEGGVGKITFLKNIMGLWLIQECKRQYQKDGDEDSYAQLEAEAANAEAFRCFIDPDAPDFLNPGGMPAKIAAFCEKTSQPVPRTRGETMRCIYESLAMKYKLSLKELEHVTNASYRKLHVVGGGVQSGILCQMTADACGIAVVAGPIEATAMGNIATQLIANGVLRDAAHAREVIRNSQKPLTYKPENCLKWDEQFRDKKARKLILKM